ncbi:protein of unknown function [Xenorhabdus poinarii G6]|uniref:Tail fiber assembly protein n=1 Tax=Xenorhabdus poinarii G6 TaxID=1354304 RepID=A0A068R0K4_9GAMM|nr:tail fiber assembly protein [Xenorhabdus poinarii]CDG20708.1 protein of unknown function [Xenorhabdus poinarii G6]
MNIYIDKNGFVDYQITPVPENLDNYLVVEVDDDIDLSDKIFDVQSGRFVIDIARLVRQSEREKQHRMSLASNSIAPLQYAVELDMATNKERDSLTEWKRYCVLLNRVDCSSAPDIDWPTAPE